MKALLIIIAILFFPAGLWYSGLEKMPTIFAAVIAMVVITVIYIIIHYILVYANKRKTKWLLSDKNPAIISAKRQDEINQQANQSNCLVALAKKKGEYAPKIKACEAEIQKLERLQAQLEAEIDAIDGLSKKDKHPETIDFLIERIESRRADSLKEALQQYDAAGRPKSTYYGRDWDLSKGISASDLPKFEDDLCELMEVLARTDDYYEMTHNWFASLCRKFVYSAATEDPAANKSISAALEAMRNCKSVIVNVGSKLLSGIGYCVSTSQRFGRDYTNVFRNILREKQADATITAREKEFIKNALIVLDRLKNALLRE